MSIETDEKLYTVPEFLELDLPDDEEYELIGGRIVAKNKATPLGPSGEHGEIISKIIYYLEAFAGVGAGEKSSGKVYSNAPCTLGKPKGSNYVKPDVCFVAEGRTPAKFRGPIPVAPDLVIEIWSPGDSLEDIQDKLEAYQPAGVRLFWSVYMLQKFGAIYRINDPDAVLLNLKGVLNGEDVLPGFELKVSTLFE